ncbi:MAG: Organic hydroperoxide resistance transcriptional regulator [Verrucomicrobia bacterium ADurb.Bin345]|nr:MAG: Organic hydroperoxide resistance transcriptional regulator [Verrucomicrobia bacterium ADurb.Bin345]
MKNTKKADALTAAQFADRVVRVMPRLIMVVTATERNYLARGLITLPQARVLLILMDQGPCRMRHIARSVGLQASTITNMVDRLAGMGLVGRHGSAADRRVVTVSLTTKGRRVLERIRKEKFKTAMEMFEHLSPRERRQYPEIMEKLVEQMKDRSRMP